MKAAVLINGSANNGSAMKKWLRIERDIKNILPAETLYIQCPGDSDYTELIKELAFRQGINFFISAGGDGSINHLINALSGIPGDTFTSLCIGTIGLGSSNDFHKPCKNTIKGIPVKLDYRNKKAVDLGLVEFQGPEKYHKRFFIINASLGFTAQGNRHFNSNNRMVCFLKPISSQLCILWSVVHTLVSYKNIPLEINFNGKTIRTGVTNLGIAKNPNISGSFKYDQATTCNSGELGIYLAENLNRRQTLRLLYELSGNRFSQMKNCSVFFSHFIEVKAADTVALETDGETFEGQKFRFSVLPESLFVAD